MNPIDQPKGKIEMLVKINADKKATAEQIEATCEKFVNETGFKEGTAGSFGVVKKEIPKETFKMPELKIKEVEKSPMIQKIQADQAKYKKEIVTKDWQGNNVKG